MSQEQKIEQLEKDMIGVKHILKTQNDNLKKIEEVLSRVAETLEQTTLIREKVILMQEEVADLKQVFEDRKETTDTNNKMFADHVSKFKGGLAVFIFMFGIIQALTAFYLKSESEENKTTREKVQIIKEEQSLMKEKIRAIEHKPVAPHPAH